MEFGFAATCQNLKDLTSENWNLGVVGQMSQQCVTYLCTRQMALEIDPTHLLRPREEVEIVLNENQRPLQVK